MKVWGRQLWWIAAVNCRAALRHRVFLILGLISVGLALTANVLQSFDFGGSSAGFVLDFGLGVIFLAGSILGVLLPAQLWFDSIHSGAMIHILVRPVPRWVQPVGCFLGVLALIFVYTCVLALITGWMIGFQSGALAWSALVGAIWMQMVRCGIIISMVLAFACCARSALTVSAVGFAFVLIGQLSGFAVSVVPPSGNAALFTLLTVTGYLVPDLSLFSLDGGRLLAEGFDWGIAGWLTFYGSMYSALYLGIGAWMFGKREF